MRLKKFKAKKYRLFDEVDFSFGKRNSLVVIDDNEKGKSSILEGILGCLYDSKKIGGITKDTLLQLEFELNKDNYIVIVGKGKKKVICNNQNITKEFIQRKSNRYYYLVGNRLLGLNEQEFLNTVFVKQQHLNTISFKGKSYDLSTTIQSAIDFSSEQTPAATALQLLKDGIKNFPRITVKQKEGSVSDEIKRLEKNIKELEEQQKKN